MMLDRHIEIVATKDRPDKPGERVTRHEFRSHRGTPTFASSQLFLILNDPALEDTASFLSSAADGQLWR